jgi:hypothetical protein
MKRSLSDHSWALGDHPVIDEKGMLPWCECEAVREGASPIRLLPSAVEEGSSAETDRIINSWRPRIYQLVERSISMARDLDDGISWNGVNEAYPCCPYLKLLSPEGRDMRRFTDEACHILLQAATREEILDTYWFEGRAPDARDVVEWMERWGTWLPDEEGQFRVWSAFLPCEAMEALYRYVHALVHDYYIEMLELHMEWEERRELDTAQGISLPNPVQGSPKEFQWIPPRLFVGDAEIWLNQQNAAELREWGVFAFGAWKFSLTETQKEDLYDLIHEADRLCPDPQFS